MKETNVGLNNQNEAIVDIKEVIEPVDDQEYLNHIENFKVPKTIVNLMEELDYFCN